MSVPSPSTATERAAIEVAVNRNPHRDFRAVQAERPDFVTNTQFSFTKTVCPSWEFGDGATNLGSCMQKTAVEIDPHEEGRSSLNLAPFSYTQLINDDPPLFVIGFASPLAKAKDSLKNLVESGECVINLVSEHFVDAANSTSINAPYGQSEWEISGLTPVPCSTVQAPRVKEAIFAIEGKLLNTQEFDSRAIPGTKSGTMAIIEGVKFWVRGDAINEERNLIDPAVLKPVSRLGGISYGRTTMAYEMLRPVWGSSHQ
ncbi:hypothetical protein B7463_g2149, partial [Scytalidium lignicola]